jgi:hypothetical protein
VIPEALLATVLHLHHGERIDRTPVIIEQAAKVPPRWRQFARCVAHRESHGNARARNPHSSAQGRWQFLDTQWRQGLAHMVADRLHSHGMSLATARDIRHRLQRSEIATWPGALQDVGFAAVISTPGGSRHWALANSRCEAYR